MYCTLLFRTMYRRTAARMDRGQEIDGRCGRAIGGVMTGEPWTGLDSTRLDSTSRPVTIEYGVEEVHDGRVDYGGLLEVRWSQGGGKSPHFFSALRLPYARYPVPYARYSEPYARYCTEYSEPRTLAVHLCCPVCAEC